MLALLVFFLILWIFYSIKDSGKNAIRVVPAEMMAEASSAQAEASILSSFAKVRARGGYTYV